jgi:cell division transport system ATP-binding protein
MNTIVELKEAAIYIQDHLVLSNVNLEIKKGEFLYLIGKVGSGKTSLIKTLNAELPLKEGFGNVCGYSLTRLKKKQTPFLRRKMGIVFQDFKLLTDRSVYDNLYFVLHATGWKTKKEINSRIEEVLTMVDLSFKGYKMPHQLSGGEQQRVVIARALLNDPDLILADEPTGNLDPDTANSIMDVLLDIKKSGRAVLMATHNYNLMKKYPERTLKCEKGKLIEPHSLSEIDFSELKEIE